MTRCFATLLDILPVLAWMGVSLTFMANVPSAAASGHTNRLSRSDGHRHVLTRQRMANGLGARAKPPGTPPLIRRGADGKACRPRPSALSSSASSASHTRTSSPSSTLVPSSAVTQAPSSEAPTVADLTALAMTYLTTNVVGDAANSAAPPHDPAPTTSVGPHQDSSYQGGGSGWANTGSKLGSAWPNGNWASKDSSDYIGNYIGSKTSWYYTWSPFSVGSADALGLEYVPMLWGPKHVPDWWAQQSSWPSTVKNALFFNEPNEASQCNMSPGESVQYWMNNMVPLKSKGISLGGAAPTNAPSGLTWVQDMMRLCVEYGNSKEDCTPSFIPIHWYHTSAQDFISYIEKFHDAVGIDLWVTEYACQNFAGGAQCSEGEVWSLHQQMAEYFDSHDFIKRYAPFGMMKEMQGVNQWNALMNPDGSITSLGSWYVNNA